MRTPADDDGMTLIELLISVAILFLIVAPMTMVLQFALASAKSASHRTTDSAGAQLLTSYFAADVQGAGFVWTPASATPFTTAPYTTQCGGANTRLELQSSDASTGATTAVTFDISPAPPGSNADTPLLRRTWTVSAGACTATDSTRLVDAIDTANPPLATCLPGACATADTVRLQVNARSQNVHNSSLYTTYTFDLAATRRGA